MKRTHLILLSFILAMGLCSCGDKASDKSASKDPNQTRKKPYTLTEQETAKIVAEERLRQQIRKADDSLKDCIAKCNQQKAKEMQELDYKIRKLGIDGRKLQQLILDTEFQCLSLCDKARKREEIPIETVITLPAVE